MNQYKTSWLRKIIFLGIAILLFLSSVASVFAVAFGRGRDASATCQQLLWNVLGSATLSRCAGARSRWGRAGVYDSDVPGARRKHSD